MAKKRGSAAGKLALLAVLALAAAGVAFLLRGQGQTVRVIQVMNVTDEDAQIIAQASGITSGARVDRLDESAVRSALQPYGQWELLSIETADSRVVLHMRPRTARAVVHYVGNTLVLDEMCQVISNTRSETSPEGLLEIRGMEILTAQTGTTLTASDVNQVTDVSAVLQALVQTDTMGLVAEFNAVDLDSMYLMSRSGVRVDIGDSGDLPAKCRWMAGVLEQLAQEGITGGRVDVSTGASAVYSPG